jgi:hypothetical protein
MRPQSFSLCDYVTDLFLNLEERLGKKVIEKYMFSKKEAQF